MDFTLEKYIELINAFKDSGYSFFSLKQYLLNSMEIDKSEKIIILRHDVDKNPANSLVMAKIENSLDIIGSYYFRIVKNSYDEKIIHEIDKLGHEIGYHYEDVDLTYKSNKSIFLASNTHEILIDKSYKSFCNNLDFLRKNFDIKTICMHG